MAMADQTAEGAKVIEAEREVLRVRINSLESEKRVTEKKIADQASSLAKFEGTIERRDQELIRLREANSALIKTNDVLAAKVVELQGAFRIMRQFSNRHTGGEADVDPDHELPVTEEKLQHDRHGGSIGQPDTFSTEVHSQAEFENGLARSTDEDQQSNEEALDPQEDGEQNSDDDEGMASFPSHQEPPASLQGSDTEDVNVQPIGPPGEIMNPVRPMRCAFSIRRCKWDAEPTAIAGDPFQDMRGWAVTVEVNAGLIHRPHISLHMRFNKGGPQKKELLFQKTENLIDTSVDWRAGVSINKKAMITDLEIWHVKEHDRGAFYHSTIQPHHPDVVDLCQTGQGDKLQRLVALTFDSSASDKPTYSPNDKKIWRGLPEDIQHSLNCLFFQEYKRQITIWFCIDTDFETADKNWDDALCAAVRRG